MRLLVVVDYQNDFVDGSLGFPKAVALEAAIVKHIKDFKANGDQVVFTLDTHSKDYLARQEGHYLPVEHCIEGTHGHELYGKVKDLAEGCLTFNKPTFPSLDLANWAHDQTFDEIDVVGVVSNICVISNCIMLKAALPETPIYVYKDGIASNDEVLHKECLDVMKSLQIQAK